jgi:hypothetical protein
VASVPRAKGFVAWSSSLERLRRHVEIGLREGYPKLAGRKLREEFALPKRVQTLLENAKDAEAEADSARRRASRLKRTATRQLRDKLGISVREIGTMLGVSGARAQQLLQE